jgi:hypothetical protein
MFAAPMRVGVANSKNPKTVTMNIVSASPINPVFGASSPEWATTISSEVRPTP